MEILRIKFFRSPFNFFFHNFFPVFGRFLNVFDHFSEALTNLVADERLVEGTNATASIWATYPTQGISTVNFFSDFPHCVRVSDKYMIHLFQNELFCSSIF